MKMYDHRIAWRKTKQYSFYTLLGAGGIGLLVFFRTRGILVISRRELQTRDLTK